jgi:general stress protein 26
MWGSKKRMGLGRRALRDPRSDMVAPDRFDRTTDVERGTRSQGLDRLRSMTRSQLLEFLRRHRLGVLATTAPDGTPEAAVVGFAVTDELELVFDTLDSTRKAIHLRRDARIAFVIGWDEEQTVQLEGLAHEPWGAELERVRQVYFERFPDGRARASWPGLVYFRVIPRWARYSDYRGKEPVIVELSGRALEA